MNLVERYVAAVQRELPKQQQKDIGRELQANIMDQIEALEAGQGNVSDADISGVLKAMGHPRKVALQFCPPKPLISAKQMPLYLHTLYMVLGVLFVITTIKISGRWLSGTEFGLLSFIFAIARNFLESTYFAFTAITVAFVITSRGKKIEDNDSFQTCSWAPEKLPPAGQSWQHISLQDIFTDLATLLFLVMLIWYPLWHADSGLKTIFTAEALNVLSWFTPVIVIGILHSLWQLRTRIWSRNMLLLNVVVNLAFLGVSLLLLTMPVLQIGTERFIDIATLAINCVLVFIMLMSAYEVVRDSRRLLRM